MQQLHLSSVVFLLYVAVAVWNICLDRPVKKISLHLRRWITSLHVGPNLFFHVIWMQELESSVEGWTDDLTSLFLLRDSLEGVVSADDITVLQERLQLLQRQWEEVCHQVDANSTQHVFFSLGDLQE